MSELIRRRLTITGTVQGVFFRDSTARVAQRTGLTGWIRNDPDGRVTAELQGTPDAVGEAVEFCRVGPSRAQVDDVTVEQLEVDASETDFEVR